MTKRNIDMQSDEIVTLETSSAAEGAGVYLWDIATDLVFADSAAAQTFGFDNSEAKAGLPISRYLERMHPDDVPRVAGAIHDAIISGGPYQEEYRVCHPDGSMVEVLAVGSCFRSPAGEAFQYAGILFPKEVSAEGETTIRQLCIMAHDLARKDGKTDVAEKLVDILVSLGRQQFEKHLPAAGLSRH